MHYYNHFDSHLLGLFFSDDSGKNLNSSYGTTYELVGIQVHYPGT